MHLVSVVYIINGCGGWNYYPSKLMSSINFRLTRKRMLWIDFAASVVFS